MINGVGIERLLNSFPELGALCSENGETETNNDFDLFGFLRKVDAYSRAGGQLGQMGGYQMPQMNCMSSYKRMLSNYLAKLGITVKNTTVKLKPNSYLNNIIPGFCYQRTDVEQSNPFCNQFGNMFGGGNPFGNMFGLV